MMDDNHGQDRFCGVCGSQGTEGQRFCRQCGSEFPIEAFEDERNLRVALRDEKGISCLSSLMKPAVMIGAFFITCYIVEEVAHVDRWKVSKSAGRERACYANMRVLLGAIEMYNMDNAVMINTVDGTTEDRMIDGKYLKSRLSRPEPGCCYSSAGNLQDNGFISCSVHGPVEAPR